MAAYYIGIDGGGSTVRAAAVDDELNVIAHAQGETVNPSAVGRAVAAQRIQECLRSVVGQLDEGGAGSSKTIRAVGIGVAGASAVYAADWLREVVSAALPGVPVAASMDNEIALVGAHGERRGVMVLAGTGSVAYGVNDAGEAAQTGGWGYLVGDDGSGYWLGNQALRALIRWADGMADDAEALALRVMQRLDFKTPVEVIGWLYRQPPPTREVAQLAGLVLEAADADDPYAQAVIAQGADELVLLVRTIERRLRMTQPRIAFAGGLLSSENALSRALRARLGLSEIPLPRYPPVVGAALLAKISLTSEG